MRRCIPPCARYGAATLLTLAGIGIAPLRAQVEVAIRQPSIRAPIFGKVKIEAQVWSDPDIVRVDFLIDDFRAGSKKEPPWEMVVDVGGENREHVIRVIARDVDGEIGSAERRTPAARIDEEFELSLRQLYVTVSRNGQRVTNLEEADFRVFDEGDRQKIITFERGDVPLTAAIVVDASDSMSGEPLDAAVRGAQTFIEGMASLDEAMLLLSSDSVLYSTPFSSFASVIGAGLDSVEAKGGTALNDHLYLVLKKLEKRQGRRVVILLSDGRDIHSVLDMDDVLWATQRSQALIYWIRLGAGDERQQLPFRSLWRSVEQHRKEIDKLETAVEQSGGRIEDIASLEDIPAAFERVLSELREQYVLGYYPSEHRGDGRWRKVEVKVEGNLLDVRTRGGYLDF